MTDRCDTRAEGIVTCGMCIQKIKQYEEVGFPVDPGVYVVRVHRTQGVKTHYFNTEIGMGTKMVCGLVIPEYGKVDFKEATPTHKATCTTCLASPKVPSTLRDTQALQSVYGRGRYHRSYPTEGLISD